MYTIESVETNINELEKIDPLLVDRAIDRQEFLDSFDNEPIVNWPKIQYAMKFYDQWKNQEANDCDLLPLEFEDFLDEDTGEITTTIYRPMSPHEIMNRFNYLKIR